MKLKKHALGIGRFMELCYDQSYFGIHQHFNEVCFHYLQKRSIYFLMFCSNMNGYVSKALDGFGANVWPIVIQLIIGTWSIFYIV